MRRRGVPPRFAILPLLVAALVSAGQTVAGAAEAAKNLPSGIQAVTSVEGISEYRLTNGMRVLLFPDPSKQTATVNVTYLVGSRHEGYGETGMAHLLEHLVFKGTPRHPDIPDELTAHGCRPNGSTWYDRTNYFETFAATDENLAWALDMESDRMVNSNIAKSDLESEFSVVRNEFEMGENRPQSVLEERIMSTAYLWHNYGKSTIGSRSDIERVPIENLKAFYQKWYQPDNAILVVAGKIDEAKTLRMINDTFGKIPRPDRVLPQTWCEEPAQDGERVVTLRRVGDVQVVGAAFHVPSGSDPSFAAVDVLAYLLGDTPSGRLYKSLVETKKAASVFSWAYQLKEPGALIAFAEVRKEDSLEDTRAAMIAATEAIGTTAPPTAEEVNRAKEALLKQWEVGLRNSERAAIGLSEWSAMGDWRLMFIHRDRLAKVTPGDVAKVASAYLKSTNRTVGLYYPTQAADRVAVPQTPDVVAMVKDYRGGEGMAAGEEFDASPANIEAKVVRATVAPGIKLVMLPKKTRGSTVQVSLALHHGDEKTLQNRATAGELAGSMLMRGTTKKSRQEIQDEIDRLKTQLSVGGGAQGAYGSIETTSEMLEPSLRLLAEILRQPSFPANEFDLLKQEELAGLENSKSDPMQLAMTAFFQHLMPYPKGDPRYSAAPEERIGWVQATTLEDAKKFYQDFYGAGAGEIGVVGDFDPAAVKALVSELFAGWTSKNAYARLPSRYEEVPAVEKAIEAPDKESAVFQAGLRFPLRDDDPEYAALVLGNFMTGGGFLNSRLATRIRQKEGISYGVRSMLMADRWDKSGGFGTWAIFAPQNAERLESAFREEIKKITSDGFTADEITDAKSGWLQSRQVQRAQDRDLARTLATREHEGRTLEFDAALERRIETLTGDEILAAMKRYVVLDRMSVVKAGDFARVAATKQPAATP